jgi:phospholipid/cholesterol/gamma-HCH transport system substrate-binding protein
VATGPPLQDGAVLNTLETPTINDVVKASQGTIENLNTILAKLNTVVDNLESGKGSFGQLLVNPDLYNKFVATMDDVQHTTAKLNRADNTLGKFLNDNGQMYDRVDDALGRVDDMTRSLQAGKGTAGKLLTDEALYNNLNHSLMNLNAILADAQAGKGSAGMLLKDPTFASKLNDTLTRTDDLITNINAGKGTLGKLVTDDQMYTNVNGLLTESTKLVTKIREDPKKYLTIHLKIF